MRRRASRAHVSTINGRFALFYGYKGLHGFLVSGVDAEISPSAKLQEPNDVSGLEMAYKYSLSLP